MEKIIMEITKQIDVEETTEENVSKKCSLMATNKDQTPAFRDTTIP